MNRVDYIKLKEVCTVNQGLQIPISSRFRESGPNRYLYITIQFLKESYVDKYYIENPPPSAICKKDDLLIVRTGNTGQIITGVEGSFHNNFFKINYDKNKINGRYLYHCLTTPEKQAEMLRRAGITTIPDLNHFMFLDMEIPLPQIDVQKNIADTLDSLTIGIKSSNELIKESTEFIRRIYSYWFIQFDFPDVSKKPYKSSGGILVSSSDNRREIPKDWSYKNLNDVFYFDKGIEPGAKEYLTKDEGGCVKFYRVSDIDGQTSTYIKSRGRIPEAKPDDVLVTFDGSIGKIGLGLQGSYSSGLRKVYDPSGKYSNALAYAIMGDPYIQRTMQKYATGSIILHASESLRYLKIPYNEAMWLKFQDLIDPVFETIIKSKLEIQFLEDLRSRLLPMLMTGQVSIR